MTGSFQIRRARVADAAALAHLTAQLGYVAAAETLTVRIATLASSIGDLLMVAVDDADSPVGWLQAHASEALESGFRVEIAGLVVSVPWRRRGVGRALVSEAEAWARASSAPILLVRSNVKRTESHLFYPELGFSEHKTQRVYRKFLPTSPASPRSCG